MTLQRQDSEEQLAEIRSAHQRRLFHLRLRQAREGKDTPPEVATEIEDIEYKLRETGVAEKVVNGGAIRDTKVLQVLRELAPNEVLVKTQMLQQLAIEDIHDDIGAIREEQGESRGQREAHRQAIDSLRKDARLAAIVLLLLILLGNCSTWAVLFYLFQRGG